MMNTGTGSAGSTQMHAQIAKEDIIVMREVHRIVSKGNSAEIKRTPEGRLKVLEVSKKVVCSGRDVG